MTVVTQSSLWEIGIVIRRWRDLAQRSKILFTVSGKGGTGKTSLTAGCATCLAALGHTVLLMDGDIGLRNADIVLGVSDLAVMDFGDMLDGRVQHLEDAVIAHPRIPNLSVLPAPMTLRSVALAPLQELLQGLSAAFDYVFIDGPAGLSDWVATVASLADQLIVVATPDAVSMRDAAKLTELLSSDAREDRLVVNRVRPHLFAGKGAMYIDDIMDAVGLPLLGIVPEDERVIVAGNRGVPIVQVSMDGAAAAYRNIALRLTGAHVPLSPIRMTNKSKRDFLRRIDYYLQ